jgi:hypothetical protein
LTPTPSLPQQEKEKKRKKRKIEIKKKERRKESNQKVGASQPDRQTDRQTDVVQSSGQLDVVFCALCAPEVAGCLQDSDGFVIHPDGGE